MSSMSSFFVSVLLPHEQPASEPAVQRFQYALLQARLTRERVEFFQSQPFGLAMVALS